jgi:hypothetical protein
MARLYRVVALGDGEPQRRDFSALPKAEAQAQRWARVPVFDRIMIIPSHEVTWDVDNARLMKGAVSVDG